MPTISVPDYGGGSIVNLVATLEQRLGGEPPSEPLHPDLADAVPEAAGYVLVVFDGLGSAQLPAAGARLGGHRVAELDTVFPSTTTVALSSLATGLPPAGHGLLGYQLWIPELSEVVNTIKWTTLWGTPVDYDTASLLPAPNLWERLMAAGIEVFTVQPAHFDRSPLTKALYRGSRFEPAVDAADAVAATRRLAAPGRLVLTYLPHVDFAAHVHGQASAEYRQALDIVATAWSAIAGSLPPDVALIGTADHGHVDFPGASQIKIGRGSHNGRILYGDGRAMFVKGDGEGLAGELPATWLPLADCRPWWGPGTPHTEFDRRAPDGVLLANDDTLLLHRHSDDRMIGNHGAMTAPERRVPLLAALRAD